MADIFDQAGQQFNVDPNLLRAQMQVESGGANNAVSPQNAQGPMQIIPATAKSLGVANPFDRNQAVMGAAKLMAENLDRYKDPATAVMAYHGGTDQANWGPKTRDYLQKVQAAYGGNNVPQSNQMPGLPPTGDSGAPQQMVDPFAGLPGSPSAQPAASAPQQAQGMVDPFAGLPSAPQQVPASAASGTGAAPVQPAAGQPQAAWKPPGGITMGMGDIVKGGAQDIVHGLAWLGGKIAPNSQFTQDANAAIPQMQQTVSQQDQAYAQQRAAQGETGTDWKRMGGQAVATLPLAAVMPAGSGLLGSTVAGALSGAASSALQPVGQLQPGQTFAGQKAGQVAGGALAGGVAGPIVSGLGRVISGAGSAAQQRLAQAGVNMTPGQILGGAWQRTEDKLTSVPVLGDLIKNAQQRAAQSFNTATYNQVLAPLGQKYSGPIGNEGVAVVRKTIGDAYDNTLSQMQFKIDHPFVADLQNLGQMSQGLPAQQQQTFANILKTQIMGKFSPQGIMDGQTLKGVQSELSRMARGYLGDPSFDNRQLGQAISALKDSVDAALPRSNSPELAQQLQNANTAYANFVRLRTAAASQGAMNNGGVFTAAQLNNAVRANDKSVGKGASATGNALMQDLSGAGQQVLGSKYPDSGTAGRSMLGLAAGAAAGHAFLPPGVMAPAALGIGAAALPYTTYGQKLAQALLMSRPAGAVPIGNALSRYGVPLAGPLGATLLPGVANAKGQ